MKAQQSNNNLQSETFSHCTIVESLKEKESSLNILDPILVLFQHGKQSNIKDKIRDHNSQH